MSDPLFTPLKSHPSTWEAESKVRSAAMAEDQVTIDRLRARVEALEAALREIGNSEDHFGNWKGACQHRQRLARAALRQESHSVKSVPDQG